MKRYIRAYTAGDSISQPSDFYNYLIRDAKEAHSDFKDRLDYVKQRSPFWGHPTSHQILISNTDDMSLNQIRDSIRDVLDAAIPGDVIVYTTKGKSRYDSTYIKWSDNYYTALGELFNYLQDASPVTNCKSSFNDVYKNLAYLASRGELKTVEILKFK